MVNKEEPWDNRQFVIVAAAVFAVFAVLVRTCRSDNILVRWHCAAGLVTINTLYGFIRSRGTWTAYIGQPIILLLAYLGFRPNVRRDQIAFAVYAILAIGGNEVYPLSDGAGLLYLGYLAASVSLDAFFAALCAAETAAIAYLFATSDTDEVTLRAEHYTWWSITIFAVWDLLIFVDAYLQTQVSELFAGVSYTVSLVVVIGVLYMSANGCSLLSDALHESGDGLYIVGNFLMHYYPVIRLFAFQPKLQFGALIRGAGLGVIYALTYPASDVYGCSKPLPAYIPAVMGAVGIAIAGLLWGVTEGLKLHSL